MGRIYIWMIIFTVHDKYRKKCISNVWPGEEWATSTPAAQGIDPAAIDSLVEDLESGVAEDPGELLHDTGQALVDLDPIVLA